MSQKRNGFILFESLTALIISVSVIFTLTLCVTEQFKLIDKWEQRVNAHKIILLYLEGQDVSRKIVIKNRVYYFSQTQNKYQVMVNKNVYQIEK
ncbi:hypothetical protein COSHB9_13870 [Companilactobacillus alimentarius]|uniref:Prepilin-type N-terminal cleavage/methylation domain-containing protein n=1 Tax=Companilactobacillus alimentarius DSM 20249 TaxID=1423720 RepID=A0A2K9HNP1_9LACO|nr:hypothetical protein [Companilactobacillus alimentarius]AUI70782.1 hypothetical protein LA20249_00555 [Companilactobacillus alimentarius DSM 20249]MDT6952043.1 hypothetical protein [Companilactobacillus alimentarius]GEO45265.1 hypothetical protein LAL01_14970 [Companilactobacillus alimentarius]